MRYQPAPVSVFNSHIPLIQAAIEEDRRRRPDEWAVKATKKAKPLTSTEELLLEYIANQALSGGKVI